MSTDLGTIKCPACGAEIPLLTHGRKIIARHACLGLPEREVYEENPPTTAQAAKVDQAEHAAAKDKKK
jgi:hypothetical protein